MSKAAKGSYWQRERKGLVVDFQFRNQQVAGSSPAGGSILNLLIRTHCQRVGGRSPRTVGRFPLTDGFGMAQTG
jgi:hypothetical protein